MKPSIATAVSSLDRWPVPAWLPAPVLAGVPAGAWRSWLQEKGSLTARLKRHATRRFAVRVLQDQLRQVPLLERQLAAQPHPLMRVREVLLLVDDEPWVFARSLLPRNLRGNLQPRLSQLGNQALGQVLFGHLGMQRGPLFFCRAGQLPFASLWGRASRFQQGSQKLLVTEHFLPVMAERLGLAVESPHE